jgi:hypothetical protein
VVQKRVQNCEEDASLNGTFSRGHNLQYLASGYSSSFLGRGWVVPTLILTLSEVGSSRLPFTVAKFQSH